MKNSSHVGRAALLAALVLVFAAATVMAQDPVKVAPNNFKVLLENDRVRVLDFHSKPGEQIGMHSVQAISYSGGNAEGSRTLRTVAEVAYRPLAVCGVTWIMPAPTMPGSAQQDPAR